MVTELRWRDQRRGLKKQVSAWMRNGSVGDELDVVEQDKQVLTAAEDNSRRRTLLLFKQVDGWGFSLQTYGVQHCGSSHVDDVTYVDYVEYEGSAFKAGLRKGDIILSINGDATEGLSHDAMAKLIRSCSETMRLVVLFDDVARKVDLHLRYIKLKKVLNEKLFEVSALERQEQMLLEGRLRHARSVSTLSVKFATSLNRAQRRSLRPELEVLTTPLPAHAHSFASVDWRVGRATFYSADGHATLLARHASESGLDARQHQRLAHAQKKLRGSVSLGSNKLRLLHSDVLINKKGVDACDGGGEQAASASAVDDVTAAATHCENFRKSLRNGFRTLRASSYAIHRDRSDVTLEPESPVQLISMKRFGNSLPIRRRQVSAPCSETSFISDARTLDCDSRSSNKHKHGTCNNPAQSSSLTNSHSQRIHQSVAGQSASSQLSVRPKSTPPPTSLLLSSPQLHRNADDVIIEEELADPAEHSQYTWTYDLSDVDSPELSESETDSNVFVDASIEDDIFSTLTSSVAHSVRVQEPHGTSVQNTDRFQDLPNCDIAPADSLPKEKVETGANDPEIGKEKYFLIPDLFQQFINEETEVTHL